MIRIRQLEAEQWAEMDMDRFQLSVTFFQPLVVETQEEFDYLWSMQLMWGKEFTILLDGVDENKTGYPPSYVKVDLPLQ